MQENKTKARNKFRWILSNLLQHFLVVGVHANFLNDISPTVAKVVNAALGRMAVPFLHVLQDISLQNTRKKIAGDG